MKEENKYYVPDITEFHVGFEFEFLKNTTWMKESFLCNSQFEFTFDDFPELSKLSRVKYLDKEDIESLGWEHIQEIEFTDHTVYQFVREKYILSFEYPKRLICVFQRRDDRTVEHSFISICKNKSELKKLMQQLNIK